MKLSGTKEEGLTLLWDNTKMHKITRVARMKRMNIETAPSSLRLSIIRKN
jgi:hypothetical protein